MSDPMFILFVESQERSREFYKSVLQSEPTLDVEGMTMFEIAGKISMGLMPETNISKILGTEVPNPSQGNGIPRCEIYLFVDNPDARLQDIEAAGGTRISKMSERSWGDSVAYGMDPDGHIIALAKLAETN
ncbi:MAG: hypothetical protein KAQ65_10560 [Candidatus Thorarchaeota archaeon]|nr:hypothetical protein [Candidatus Thorarchaeota archaeon]MCK5240740.1 hypothetical protein [Candidatus Thorarchaeota archaeon]